MFSIAALCALTLSAPTPDAPDRLIGDQGVEFVQDPGVLTLFAALNAAGYSEESRRKGPPLNAPVYHPIRERLRAAMRKRPKAAKALAGLQRVFSEQPQPLEVYVEAAVAAKPSGPAAKLKPVLAPALARFAEDAKLVALFDELAEVQRNAAKQLKEAVDKDLAAASALMHERVRAPKTLLVVPNPLDAHDSLRRLRVNGRQLWIVGPQLSLARQAVVRAVLSAHLASAAAEAYAASKPLKKSWAQVRRSRRIRARYPSGADYLAQSLAAAIAFKVSAHPNAAAIEGFADDQSQAGLRWTRAAFGLLDRYKGRRPFSQALVKLAAKARL